MPLGQSPCNLMQRSPPRTERPALAGQDDARSEVLKTLGGSPSILALRLGCSWQRECVPIRAEAGPGMLECRTRRGRRSAKFLILVASKRTHAERRQNRYIWGIAKLTFCHHFRFIRVVERPTLHDHRGRREVVSLTKLPHKDCQVNLMFVRTRRN